MLTSLLRRLSGSLGTAQATSELRWMQHALDNGHVHLELSEMVARRSGGEPLQYILGNQPFGPLNLLTRPPVLIPRPETEHWVSRLAEEYRPTAQNPVSLLDLGTGSGCIPLLLCHLWPSGSINAHGVDISPHALGLAKDNAALTSQKNTFTTSQASFLADSFPDPATRSRAPFNIITSNPPYIPWNEYQQLPHSVLDYEDPKALFGGPDGLEFYRAISRLVWLLKKGGMLALEVGHDQAATVESLIRDTGRFRETEIWLDPWGKPRTVIAHMK